MKKGSTQMKLSLPFRRRRSHIGIAIEDTGIRIAEARRETPAAFTLQQAAFIPLENGVLDRGKIVNREAAELQLALACKELRLRRRKAVLAVPSAYVVIRKVKIPQVPLSDVRLLLEVELESTIHLPFARPYFDFHKWERAASPSEPEREAAATRAEEMDVAEEPYLLVAAPGELIDEYVSLFKTVDVEVVAVEIEPLALYRLLASSRPFRHQTIMFVQLGLHSVNVSIFHGDLPEFLRNIPLDLSLYTSFREAGGQAAGDPRPYLGERDMLDSFANELVRELERVISFYQFSMKQDGTRIEAIYVTGDFPDLTSVYALLQERMNSVEVLMFPIGLLNHPFAREAELHAFTVAAGLAIRG
jgi:type IV pilus assembly protein PilM